ncbi:hypothetical protein BH11BAC3_BH11BAC3_30110 [soil metagenome]
MKSHIFWKAYHGVLFILLFSMVNCKAQGQEKKISLKVLYVGYEPQKPMPENLVYYMPTSGRYAEIYQTRMPAFKLFLEKYFTQVTTVDVRDYTAKLSDKVDVTIMDAGPVKLPVGFDRPMILMAAMAPNVGLPIGLKFDWYCQCLYGEALNLRKNHAVFNTPYKVNPTMVDAETPESFFNGYQGLTTPKTMPRWKVVTEGEGPSAKPYLIGMVSHGEGFDDSPDAEVISGGVCWKNAEAVAIGRHGNYFMWGFAGSPEFMTDEANKVFVNAICYIKKFDRKPAIVKKTQIDTRTGIDEIIYRLDKNLYEKAIVSRKQGNERLKKMQQDLRDKKAAGEDIGKSNEMLLKMPMTDDVQSFEDYVKSFVSPELFAKYGTDIKLYHQYFSDNYEYFYPVDGYSLQLDKDAQQLGISNRSIKLIEKCISMLERNDSPEMAKRLLERYTTGKFANAREWRNWYTKNREKLFYTEAGGFKFMVNTYDAPAKDVPVAIAKAPQKIAEPTPADPVAVSAQLVRTQGKNMQEIIINADILKGWHIYAYVSENDPFIVTETLLELPAGAVSDKDWKSSAAVAYPGNSQIYVYENKATFKVKVNCTGLKPGAIIKCGLYYQVCDINKCYPPKKKMISLQYNPGNSSNDSAAAL